MSNTLLRDAVRAAMGLGVAATLTAGPNAFAQEEPAQLGRIVTTGSRLSQIDIEGARPITVITREAIERAGQPTVADVLRTSTLNSFGSSRETSGNDWPGQAEVDLRGLGSTRTLVLLNGRRLPRSPVTGDQFIDLNIVPLEAVERIEILQDSASAIYGSDAIGGVINVILRSDYEGAQFMAGSARPTQAGGDEDSLSVLFGTSSARGSFLVTAEKYEKGIIFTRDRPYSAVDYGDTSDFDTTEGISLIGNTAIDDATFDLIGLNQAQCDSIVNPDTGEPLFAGFYNYDSWGPGSTTCAYAYGNVSAETQKLSRQSAFVNANYEITPDLFVNYVGSYSRLEAFGRYAPAAALFEFELGPGFGAPLPATAPAEWQALNAFYLAHRFAAFGPRDDVAVNTQWQHALTFNGTGGPLDYEVSVYNTKYDAGNSGYNYINKQAAVDLTVAGLYEPWDPFSASSLDAAGLMRYTTRRDIQMSFKGASGHINFDAIDLPSGTIAWAVGFDYGHESMFDQYDPASENDNVIGSAGNSRSGSRSYSALFFEAGLPLTDTLELTLAGRQDDYSDVGSEFSPYLSMRWQPRENFLLRGSVGEGFRAPNMTNLYQLRAFSAEEVVDLVQCRNLGIPDASCAEAPVPTYSGGNPGLVPEQSQSYSIGAVFDYDEFYASIDYWNVDITDGISEFEAQSLLDLEANGQGLPPGTSITRGGTGAAIQIDTGWANVAVTDVTGTDLNLRYQLDAGGFGTVDLGLLMTYIFEYKEKSDPLSALEDTIGTDGQPQFKTNLTARWNRGPHTVTWITRYIDSYVNTAAETIPSWTISDVQYNYQILGWNAEVSVGIQNIADKDPPLDDFNTTAQVFDSDLYDMDGRVPYVFYRQRF